MNRRGFLGRFLGAAALVAPAVAEAVPPELPDAIVSGGIEAKWIGWKSPSNQDLVFGYWVFTLPDGRMSYSTTFGGVRRNFHEGDVLDPCRYQTAPLLTSRNDTPTLRAELRTAAYERGLKDSIAWMYEPHPSPEPEYKFGFTGFKPTH